METLHAMITYSVYYIIHKQTLLIGYKCDNASPQPMKGKKVQLSMTEANYPELLNDCIG